VGTAVRNWATSHTTHLIIGKLLGFLFLFLFLLKMKLMESMSQNGMFYKTDSYWLQRFLHHLQEDFSHMVTFGLPLAR
jgi:hypothetical protein